MKLKNLKEGYAIVLYQNYNRYFDNTVIERIEYDELSAKYDAEALSRADNINYCVYDCKYKRLIY